MSTGIGIGASFIFGGIVPSPSFEYDAVSYCKNASNPTPTINGTPGGVFTAAPVSPSTGTLVINSSTGEVDIAASDPGNYLVTYTVSGVAESDPFQVVAMQTTGFSYSASSFEDNGIATPTITGSAGGTFTSSPAGLSINSSTGVIDLAASTIGGPYTITYSNNGICAGTPSTFDVTITATVRIIANNFAMEFDGTDEYVSAGNPSELQLTGDISVSAWFKTSDSGTQMVIVGRGHIYSSSLSSWCLFRRTNNGLAVQLRSGSAYQYALSPATTYNDGNWHNAVFTREVSSGDLKLYIDGSLVVTTPSVTSALDNETQNTYIGADTQPAEYFDGDIDEVAIWNTALSPSAVQEIYDATINNPGYSANLFKLANESSDPVFWNRMGD